MNQTSSKPMHSASESALIEHVTLDCDNILTHAGGDPELLLQLCRVFLNELPVRMDAVRDTIKSRSNAGMERALQQLRNCIMVFGSGQVSFTAEKLEAALRGGNARQLQREWKRLEAQLQVLVPQVQILMLEMSSPKGLVQ